MEIVKDSSSVSSNWSNYADTYDEWDESDKKVCPTCHGTGLDRDEYEDCPVCGGEGELVSFDTRQTRVVGSQWRTTH